MWKKVLIVVLKIWMYLCLTVLAPVLLVLMTVGGILSAPVLAPYLIIEVLKD